MLTRIVALLILVVLILTLHWFWFQWPVIAPGRRQSPVAGVLRGLGTASVLLRAGLSASRPHLAMAVTDNTALV